MSCFIAIEGIEGAGKSTLRGYLSELFNRDEREIVVTREPGATPLGQHIRDILLDPNGNSITPIAELMLFAADRAQHLEEVIRPALERNAIVVCDRFIYSTIAYQGYGRSLPVDQLISLNDFITQGLKPDLVLLLDLDPEEGLKRAKMRAEKASNTMVFSMEGATNAKDTWTRFEQQELEFHKKVRQGFLDLSAEPKNNFLVLDASKSPQEVAEEAKAAVRRVLGA